MSAVPSNCTESAAPLESSPGHSATNGGNKKEDMSAVPSNCTESAAPLESSPGHSATNGGSQNDYSCNEATAIPLEMVNDAQTTEDDKSSDSDKSEKNFSFFNMSRRNKMIILLCCASNFIVAASYSIPAPFFPEEAEKKGLSTTTVGLIFSVFELVFFISSPIIGNYLSRIGTKFVLVAGMLAGGSFSILFGLLDKLPSGTIFAAMCFTSRSLEALAMSSYLISNFAILSHAFPKNVATVIGILETVSGMGMMIGPALGGALYELGGYGLPFFVLGSLIIITGTVMATLLPKIEGGDSERKGSIWVLLRNPRALISLLSIFLCSVGLSFLSPTLSKHLETYNLSIGVIGLMFVIAPGLYALVSPAFGYLVDKKKVVGSLIVIGHLVYGIAFFFIGPSPWLPFIPSKLWIVIIGLALAGIGIGCVSIPNIANLVQGASDIGFEDNLDTFAIISGLFNSFFTLGGFVGPTVGGILVDQIGFGSSSSIIGAGNLFVFFVVLIFFMRRPVLGKKASTADTPSVAGEQEDKSGEVQESEAV